MAIWIIQFIWIFLSIIWMLRTDVIVWFTIYNRTYHRLVVHKKGVEMKKILCFVVGVCGGLVGKWAADKTMETHNLAEVLTIIVISILTTLVMNEILR